MTTNEKLKKGDVIRYGAKHYLLVDWCRSCGKLWLQGVEGIKMVKYKDAKLVKL